MIVARSYVYLSAQGSNPADPSVDSRPDDLTPRDHVGHGTAVASVAAAVSNTGEVTFNGIAPKAFLGNYKIYGSPQLNDSTTDQAIVQAADDAFNDGMDVLSFSSGGPAFTGPLDTGATCGNSGVTPCDLVAYTFERLAQGGMVVVVAAGNQNQTGLAANTFNSISSPANAPSVIAAGATTNGHQFGENITVPGGDVPSNLQAISAQFGNGIFPTGSVSAPLRDAAQAGNDGFACAPLTAGSMTGAIALVERGPVGGACTFATKLANAQAAGAVGVIFYNYDSSSFTGPGGLGGTTIPSAMISNADGLALKTFIDSHAGHLVSMDPAGVEQAATPNQVAYFSSVGPTILGDLKPDVLAPGTNIYMAAEKYDPLGELYSSNGYGVAQGTSFSTPIVSGAAALVIQKHPTFTSGQIKSAIVNTAAQTVTTDDSGNLVDIRSTGGGLLDTNAAVNTTVTVVPASLSFEFVAQAKLPVTIPLAITNTGSVAQSLSLSINKVSGSATGLTLDKQSLVLAPGTSSTVQVTFAGPVGTAGIYSGTLLVSGTGVLLRVPYLYAVGDGVAADMIPLTGAGFDGTVGQGIPEGVMSFMLIDQYGVPVANAPVTWTPQQTGLTLTNKDATTDSVGIAFAQPLLGSTPGNYSVKATAGGLSQTFSGSARPVPTITDAQDAATYQTAGLAPGSYIALSDKSGALSLSDFTDLNTNAARLPLAIDYASVSFDAGNISVPGHISYVSGGQINVQVPWELAGQTSAKVKVTIDFSNGNVFTIPIAAYAPGFFETGTGVVAALDANFQKINAGNPAKRGAVVQLYANGLGPVDNQPASGDPGLAQPLSHTTTVPIVTIGGRQLTPGFSGLTPTVVGLYQMNVTIPADMPTGNQQITVSIGGQTSKASGIVIQ